MAFYWAKALFALNINIPLAKANGNEFFFFHFYKSGIVILLLFGFNHYSIAKELPGYFFTANISQV